MTTNKGIGKGAAMVKGERRSFLCYLQRISCKRESMETMNQMDP